MATLVDKLHDEIDLLEAWRDEAKAKVREIAMANIREALASGVDNFDGLSAVVLAVEDGMTDLTTTAFVEAAAYSKKRWA